MKQKKPIVPVTAAIVVCSLVAAGCSSTASQLNVATSVEDVTGGLASTLGSATGLAALPSDSPDSGFEAGGGGLIGDPAPIWGLPGARGTSDPGISPDKLPVATTISLRPEFTAAPGKDSYQFTVQDAAGKNTIWDSGQVNGSNGDCTINDSQASCILPNDKVGVLANGSTYRLVTTAGGVTSPRLFRVDVPQGATGGTGTLVLGRKYNSSVSSMQVGVAFSTANQGPTSSAATSPGARWGLPVGWQWQGPSNGFVTISRSDSATSYSGFTQLLSVNTSTEDQTLGCKSAPGATQSVCGPLTGELTGIGFAAVINPDRSVVVTDQASGQNWTFNANDQLVASGVPGGAPVTYAYRDISAGNAVLDTMSIPATGWTWKFHYSGDAKCQDQSLPNGFATTPAGAACGWTEPDGGTSVILYTQPNGATTPRLSRVIHTPSSCATWQNCDTSQLGIFDLGWDSKNRIAYQRQDALVDAAVVGAIEPTNKDFWAQLEFDELGRLKSVQQALNKSDGSGNAGAIGGAKDTYDYQPADSAYSPATSQVVKTSTLQGSPTFVDVIASDDAGRVQFRKDADGVVTASVWDEDLPLKFADITDNNVSSTSYDEFNRTVATYSGNIKSFNTDACAPNAANRTSKSCQPANDSANAALTSKTKTYDQASATGNGLRAQWFDNPNLSGNPTSASELNQVGSKGFSVSAPGKSDNWAVRLSGGVVLDKAATWNLKVNVPKNMFASGSLFVDNQLCTLVVAGQTSTSCTFTSDGSTYPIRLDLAHQTGGPASGAVTVTLQQDQFAPPVSGNDHFIPFWGVPGSTNSVDHNPDGSAYSVTENFTYGSPLAGQPTKQTTNPTKGAPDQPKALVRTTTYSPNGFGGAVVDSVAGTSGTKKTQEYWGISETPSQVPNADQLPATVKNVAQQGFPRISTSPSGQQEWTVYNVYGNPVCSAAVQSGTAPEWSCQERDERSRLVKSTLRGQDGQTPIELSYQYSFNSDSGSAPFVTAITKTQGSTTAQEVSREWPGGQLDTYVAADGSNTTYTYEPRGAVQSATTQIPHGAAAKLLGHGNAANGTTSLTYTYTYDDLGRPATIADDNSKLAEITYRKDDPRQIESYSYLDGKLSQTIKYDGYDRATGNSWTLPSGTVENNVVATAAGRKLSDQFDNVSHTYTYDGFSRLTKSETKVGDAVHDFSYGWDADSQRTCAAVDIANPTGKSCDQLSGATAFGYKNNVLVSSSAADSKIPADALTKDGSYRQVGAQTYEYDAAGKLVKAVDSSAPAPSPSASGSPSASASTAPSGSASAQPSESSAPDSGSDSASADAAVTGSPSATASSAAPTGPTQVTYVRDASSRVNAQGTQNGNAANSGGFSLVYGKFGAGTSPVASVSNTGTVTRLVTLPGGLSLRGDAMQIAALSGTASIDLTADGSKAQTNAWGPFGEQVSNPTNSPNVPAAGWQGQDSAFNGTLMNLGARSYHTDLGMFLQVDPISGGSGTMNDHAYVAGDPINSSDLSGTMSDSAAQYWAYAAGIGATLVMQMLLFGAIGSLTELLPESFLTGAPAKIVSSALSAGVGMGVNMGMQYGLTGKIDTSLTGLLVTGISAAVAGIVGGVMAMGRAESLAIQETVDSFVVVDSELIDWGAQVDTEESSGSLTRQSSDSNVSRSTLEAPVPSPISPSSFSSDEGVFVFLDGAGNSPGEEGPDGWFHPTFDFSTD